MTNMKSRSTQFGVRENTASLRQHDSRLATDARANSIRTEAHNLRTRLATLQNETLAPDDGNPSYAAPAATGGDALTTEVAGEPQFLTVSEVAIRLRVSRNWVYNHARSLGAYHLGKYLRFSWSKVLQRLGDNS